MFNIALFEPEIPQNCGAIIRLCANSGNQLHLIEPLGFDMQEKRLRRAGLDYRDMTVVTHHENYEAFLQAMQGKRIFACTTKATQFHHQPAYQPGDVLLFGPESRGLPPEIRDPLPNEQKIRIPMVPDSRSLNLANAVSIISHEAWRQHDFAGGE